MRVPPVACIEILPSEDTVSGMQARIDDYLSMGVQNIWIVDPIEKKAWTADEKDLYRAETTLRLPEYGAEIALSLLWSELDDLAASR